MTFTELVTEVLQRTRQTSGEATTRIGREVNDRNRRVTSSIGLTTARRRLDVTHPVLAGENPVVFADTLKVLNVYLTGPLARVLGELTADQWRQRMATIPQTTSVPNWFAVLSTTASDTVIGLFPTPDQPYTLRTDCIQPLVALVGVEQPSFSPDFHDVIMHGALADEWTQLQQKDLAVKAEQQYEARLAELRMFIAKSAYLDIHQGARGGFNRGDYLPGYFVPPPGWF